MTKANETLSFSGTLDMSDRWEIEWCGDRWDFMLGDRVSWSHYSSERLIHELRSYRKFGHTSGAKHAIFFAQKLAEHFEIDKGKLDYEDILRMSPEELVQASWYDAFICHASEDKESFVRPLAHAMRQVGLNVWYDEFCLGWGDELRRSIDYGLANSKFGVVVLSPAFLEKNWPQYELDGLFSRQIEGEKVLLPIWHNLTKSALQKKHPSLVNIKALNSLVFSIDEIAGELKEKLRGTKKA